jgi:hypothetical protein
VEPRIRSIHVALISLGVLSIVLTGLLASSVSHGGYLLPAQATQAAEQEQLAQIAADETRSAQEHVQRVAKIEAAVQQTSAVQASQVAAQFGATQTAVQATSAALDRAARAEQVMALATNSARRRLEQATEVVASIRASQTPLQATQDARIVSAVQQTITALPTSTPGPAQVNVFLEGCETGVEGVSGRGEITYAYVRVDNAGSVDVENVYLLAQATDPDSTLHPSSLEFIHHLPAGYQTTRRLIVDTRLGKATTITAFLTGPSGLHEVDARPECQELNADQVTSFTSILGSFLPIPGKLPRLRN